ncbi:tRNA dimethylallyltransferase isoform X1 [Vespa velutina]|uniref:tRNA dimethylallyltransferase isoform X1 n=2 Tax=Vespa velutina TaxID=202808 RepID=UPI001FB22E71|nr:tRNA dimethylallyltransferase isoform X1 [Vespa velutina]XP_047360787.1 tRNA dimethylallyltransferase isoform X1 [Vespa velutina]XP_047360797.1 tRNA dimethylallyltransferase isoform X1 [Vespa velutina]
MRSKRNRKIYENSEMKMSRVPILVILGSTGSGKSKLGIELARRFCGEIISADSMQVYKGLDIVTAKVTKEEKQMAVHHMLDIVDPLTYFSVIDFRDMVLPIVDDLLLKKKMPIVVGGTNYYIESVLWKILVSKAKKNSQNEMDQTKMILSDNDKKNRDENTQETLERSETEDESSPSKKMKIDGWTSEETNEVLYRRLAEIDPEMAQRLHPNNRRKVIRSLEVFEEYGITHSEILKTQRLAGGSGLGGPLRYPNSIILWLRCDKKILDERLSQRVDSMIQAGLVDELLDFHRRYNEQRIKSNTSPDYTKGIFQSIGFKEFHDYLILPEEERASEKAEKLLKQGLDDLKMVTRRYANNQQKWIRNRLMRRTDRQVPPLYVLDCTDLTQWKSNVFDKAVSIISTILRGEKPEEKPINENVENQKNTDSSNEVQHYCEICERIFIGELQWNAHINGLKHKKILQRMRKMEKQNSGS